MPAIDARKIQIEQDQIGPGVAVGISGMMIQPDQSLLAVVGQDELVHKSPFFKGPANEENVAVIILRQQNPALVCGHLISLPRSAKEQSTSGAIPRRQSKSNCNAWAITGLNPNPAPVSLHNFTRNRESEAGPGHLRPLQTMEGQEQPFPVLGIDSFALIAHREKPSFWYAGGAYFNDRRLRSAKFQGVRDQMLEQLRQTIPIAEDLRQIADRDRRAGLADRPIQVLEREPHGAAGRENRRAQAAGRQRIRVAGDPRQQLLSSGQTLQHLRCQLASFLIPGLIAGGLEQEFGRNGGPALRGAQVMDGRVEKVLDFAVQLDFRG